MSYSKILSAISVNIGSFVGILYLTLWKLLREITLLIFQQRLLKGPIAAKPLSWSKGIFPPKENLEKLAREAQ